MSTHNCEYVDLSRDSMVCDIIKKNCERCLTRIFNVRLYLLLKKNRNKENFLYKCVKYDNSNFLKILLCSEYFKILQLTVNNQNIKGRTILHESIINLNKSSFEDDTSSSDKKIDCLEVLIKDCDFLNYDNDCYMHYIIDTITDPRKILKYLRLITENKLMSVHRKDFNNNTLLHAFFKRDWTSSYALSDQSHAYTIDLLTYLISLNINLDAKNSHGDTILRMCIRTPGNEDFLKVLLLGGVAVNYLLDDLNFIAYAPIHHIIFKDSFTYMGIFLTYGKDVDINIKSSRILHTPLHTACCSDMPNASKIVELLLNKGCSIDERCSAGLLAIDYAKWYNLPDNYECVMNADMNIALEYTDDTQEHQYTKPFEDCEIPLAYSNSPEISEYENTHYEDVTYENTQYENIQHENTQYDDVVYFHNQYENNQREYVDYREVSEYNNLVDVDYINKIDIPYIDEYCKEDFTDLIPDDNGYFEEYYFT